MKRLRSQLSYQHLYVGVALLAAFGLGWYVSSRHVASVAGATGVSLIRVDSPGYRYINPILLVDNSGQNYPEYKPLDDLITGEANALVAEGKAENISVYFRDLNTGKWTGTDQDTPYAPSSMLKVITLIAYLKMAEDNPDLLHQQMHYTPQSDPGQYYKPVHTLAEGDYSIRDLLLQMIIQSDNSAMKLLNDAHPTEIADVYRELDLPSPTSPNDDFMSAEMFSRVFRTLYSSTYLSREYSEEALDLLTYTAFNQGLTQGTASTTVAHKFGEHTALDQSGDVRYHELHDCGVVYYPGNPYFLCVMTKGGNFDSLSQAIGDISKTVYGYVGQNPWI